MRRAISGSGWMGMMFLWFQGMSQAYHTFIQNGYPAAGAYSTHFMDAFSFTENSACAGRLDGTRIGMLAERKWMLKELDDYELAVTVPIGTDGLGIAAQYRGGGGYQEESVQWAYGKRLGSAGLGMQLSYLHAAAAGYGGPSFLSAGIAFRFRISEKWIAGWMINLPVRGKAGVVITERGAELFRIGFGYETRTDLLLSFRVEKNSGRPADIHGDVEYRYNEQFFFSIGFSSLSATPYFKSGWKKNTLDIQLYVRYENVLGFSPGIVLCWEGKNRKK